MTCGEETLSAVFLPKAAITPQEQLQKKIDKIKLKLTEIEKLEVSVQHYHGTITE